MSISSENGNGKRKLTDAEFEQGMADISICHAIEHLAEAGFYMLGGPGNLFRPERLKDQLRAQFGLTEEDVNNLVALAPKIAVNDFATFFDKLQKELVGPHLN